MEPDCHQLIHLTSTIIQSLIIELSYVMCYFVTRNAHVQVIPRTVVLAEVTVTNDTPKHYFRELSVTNMTFLKRDSTYVCIEQDMDLD